MFNFFKFITKKKKTADFRFDAAQTHRNSAVHWSQADDLSADAAMSPEVRRIVRNRARYETANNSYAKGLVLTLAEFCIGTGPRLQLLTNDKKYNSIVEQEFAAWAESVRLGDKLKTLRQAKAVDGEAFAVIIKNPKVKHDVRLDLRLIEADRVATPYPNLLKRVDGFNYDAYGNVVSYDVLDYHPGDTAYNWRGTARTVSAEFVLHWYRQDRPEQSRGISELMPALPLFADLRRYSSAVISAAETAADFSALIHTNQSGELQPLEARDTIPLEKRMMTVLPEGWDVTQLKAEQPTTTYQMFKREVLTEIGRCLQIPANIILGDSSNYNYASGRLDHQTFFKSIKNEQAQCEKVVLFPLFELWYWEAVRCGLLDELPVSNIGSQFARFYWDGVEHVDPVKEAKAAQAFIDAGISNLSIECARRGYDWEDVQKQRAREQVRIKELGISLTPEVKEEIIVEED